MISIWTNIKFQDGNKQTELLGNVQGNGMLYIALQLLIMPKMCIFILISANIFIVKGILMYSIIFPYN